MELKYLATVTEEEKKKLIMLKERIEALNELQLGFGTLNIENEDFLLDKIKNTEQNTKEQIREWWDDKMEKYKIEKVIGEECVLQYSTNKLFLKNS